MSKLVVLLTAIALVASACGGGNGAAGPEEGQETAAGQVPFDQAFIDAMVPHHQEAIDMAEAALARGLTQADLEAIADDIVSAQQREIDEMLEWRQEWFGSRTLGPVLPEVLGVPESDLGMGHGTADEIAGAIDADATFAAMMIAHHRGAIAMAEAAQELAEHGEITELADAIIEAQQREIGIMEPHTSAEHHG